jgi:DNA-directed RNA polymerase subunit M/transcription elongation factor TFIIS
MSDKPPWLSDIPCPKCGKEMMYRNMATTPTHFRALVVCRLCGTFQNIKESLVEEVSEVAEIPAQRESIGQQIYGGKRRHRAARRIHDEE